MFGDSGAPVAPIGTITDAATGSASSMTGMAFDDGVLYGQRNVSTEGLYTIDLAGVIRLIEDQPAPLHEYDLGSTTFGPTPPMSSVAANEVVSAGTFTGGACGFGDNDCMPDPNSTGVPAAMPPPAARSSRTTSSTSSAGTCRSIRTATS